VFQRPCLDIIKHLDKDNLYIDAKSVDLYLDCKSYIENYIKNIERIRIPSYLRGALISIETGSDTRIFVKKVMEWAQSNKKSELFDNEIFTEINECNTKIISIFKELQQTDQYHDLLITELKENNLKLRTKIQELSKLCDVEIEPTVLSKFMDDIVSKINISYIIVPGGKIPFNFSGWL
jgi:phosphomevalonate kinase